MKLKLKSTLSSLSSLQKSPDALPKQRQVPEEGSFRHALVTNPWKYLWAHPMAWHYGHLRVFNCPPPFVTRASITPSTTQSHFNFDLIALHSSLAQFKLPDSRNLRLREVIKGIVIHKKLSLGIQDLKIKRE
jgi:hypothetical protein